MKTKILIPIMAIIAIAAGCSSAPSAETDLNSHGSAALTESEDASAPPEDPVVLQMETAPDRFFNRYITVSDETGQSSVRLRIVTNDADALDIFATSDFQLRVGASPGRVAPYPRDEDPTDVDDESEDRVKVLIFEAESRSRPA